MNGEDRPRRRTRREEEPLPDVPRIGEDPDQIVRSRTSLKRERVNNEKALKDLVSDLLHLNEEACARLGVPGPTIDALADARRIKSHGARERHLRLIRATLRASDWAALRRRIDLERTGISAAAPEERVTEWTEQLVVQGDPGLARFLEEYPDADRKRLRQLVRNVASATPGKRGKARLVLEQAVSHVLAAASDEGPGPGG